MAGRAADSSRAAGRRLITALIRAARTPLARVVTGVATAGVVCSGLVMWATAHAGITGPVFELRWVDGTALAGALAVLTCTAELVAVRLRHRDAVEELTLLDPLVVLNVLLLPPGEAIIVTLVGIVLAYAIRRRAPLKALFNVGTYSAATSLLVLLLRTCAGTSAAFDLRLIAAMLIGTAGFVAVNLVSMSLLFAALGAGTVRQLVRQDLRLSVFTLVSTLALAATVATIAAHTPAFLLFTVLPAAAITYAYRATATEAQERQRSACVLAFSQVLAAGPTPDVAIPEFLRLARDGFFADEVLAVFDDGTVLELTGEADQDPRSVPLTARHRQLLAEAANGAALLDRRLLDRPLLDPRVLDRRMLDRRALDHALPAGWSAAMVAPLEADGRRVGAVALGWRAHARLQSGDLTILASLASSLASALSRARHLAKLVEETSKLRAVLDQSSDGILVLDGGGIVQLWNPALVQLSGRTVDAALGAMLGDLLDTQDLEGNPVDAFEEGCRQLSPAGPAGDRRRAARPARRRVAVGEVCPRGGVRRRGQSRARCRQRARPDQGTPAGAAQVRLRRHGLTRVAHPGDPDQGLRRPAAPALGRHATGETDQGTRRDRRPGVAPGAPGRGPAAGVQHQR